MFFDKEYWIRIEDTDSNGMVTTKALLSIMEDIGSTFSTNVGYGIKDVSVKNRTWILLDWQIKLIKRPEYLDKIKVTTWAREFDKVCAYRDYEIFSEQGELLAIGSSRWTMIDVERKRPVRLDDEITKLYQSENKHVFDTELQKLKVNEDKFSNASIFEYKTMRRDIDVNGHMHNINYLDLALEAIPEDIYNSVSLEYVRIQYKKEITPNSNVQCRYYFENGLHYIIISTGDVINSILEFN